jgi:8-oxo-(d)GTP phosphatase
MPLLLLRHASAGHRAAWSGDDHERPLDERGVQQVEHLADVLAPFRVDRILTSPYLRCVQTVEPLAAARGLDMEVRQELSEEQQHSDGVALVRSLAGDDVVVCGHGGLETALPDPPKWKKGMTFVVDARLDVLEVLRA